MMCKCDHVPRLLLCLALGLLSTIAIAWSSAALDDLNPFTLPQSFLVNDDDLAPVAVILNIAGPGRHRSCLRSAAGAWVVWGPEQDESLANSRAARAILDRLPAEGFPPRWGRMPDPAEVHGRTLGDVQWMQDARGWPMLALWCEWIGRGPAARPSPPLGGLPLPPSAKSPRLARALPYRPIPLGLAVDTLVFALAWTILLTAPGAIRTRVRRRRNQCPDCGYSRAGLDPQTPCPECGHRTPHA